MFGPTFIPLDFHVSNDIHHAHQHGMDYEKSLKFFNIFKKYFSNILMLWTPLPTSHIAYQPFYIMVQIYEYGFWFYPTWGLS